MCRIGGGVKVVGGWFRLSGVWGLGLMMSDVWLLLDFWNSFGGEEVKVCVVV